MHQLFGGWINFFLVDDTVLFALSTLICWMAIYLSAGDVLPLNNQGPEILVF